MKPDIRKLAREDFEGKFWTYEYETGGHYRAAVREKADGWEITLAREEFDAPVPRRWNEAVVTPYKGDAEIYGAFLGGKEAGFIQIEFQEWNRSVRVWDMLVLPGYRRKGVGRALMKKGIGRARELGARRVILETQTCNLNAISFYRAMGFKLAGLDTSNYNNDDIARNDVRIEMALHLD